MKRCFLTLALLAILTPAFAGIPDDAEPAFLMVSVNGHSTDVLGQFWKAGDTIAGEPSEWARVGLVLTDAEKKLPSMTATQLGVKIQIDETTASVDLTAPGARMPEVILGRDGLKHPTLSPAATGVLLNYNLAGAAAAGQQSVSAAHEVRVGGRWGTFSTTGQLNWDKNNGEKYIRGNSILQYDDNKRLNTYQGGDVMVGGAHLGGVRIAHDPAALDPLTATYPTPTLGGLAIDAGTVEILNNQAKTQSTDVVAGPFLIEGFPVTGGRNQLDVVLRDKFGRETVLSSQEMYFTPSLLRKGLTTWEAGAGMVRHGQTDKYGPMGASFAAAHGVSDRLTVEGGAQSTQNSWNATTGVRTIVGTAAGVMTAKAGVSGGVQGHGSMFDVAWDYRGPRFSAQVRHQQSDNWWSLSNEDPFHLHATQSTRVSATYRAPSNALQMNVTAVDMTAEGRRTQFTQLGGRWQKGSNSIEANVLYDMRAHAPTATLVMRHTFGALTTMASVRAAPDLTQYQVGAAAQVNVHDMTLAGSVDATSDDRGNRSIIARAFAATNKGAATLEVRQINGHENVTANLTGALHFGRGGIQVLPYISDGYAVVSIPGVQGIPVEVNGRTVGKTNKGGELVVANITSLIGTSVRLDDRKLPAQIQLESSEAIAAPKRLAGALVTFPVRTMNARTFNVTLDGKPMPTGSAAKSDKEDTQVGFDGELFLEHAQAGQSVTITHDTGNCSITIPSPLPAFGDVVTLECK